MKGIILALSLIVSNFAFAQFNWQVEDINVETGLDSASIQVILEKYPTLLEGTEYEISDIHFVHLTTSTFKFVGQTVCQEGDERLTAVIFSSMVCPEDATKCIFEMGDVPSQTDPCL